MRTSRTHTHTLQFFFATSSTHYTTAGGAEPAAVCLRGELRPVDSAHERCTRAQRAAPRGIDFVYSTIIIKNLRRPSIARAYMREHCHRSYTEERRGVLGRPRGRITAVCVGHNTSRRFQYLHLHGRLSRPINNWRDVCTL